MSTVNDYMKDRRLHFVFVLIQDAATVYSSPSSTVRNLLSTNFKFLHIT